MHCERPGVPTLSSGEGRGARAIVILFCTNILLLLLLLLAQNQLNVVVVDVFQSTSGASLSHFVVIFLHMK